MADAKITITLEQHHVKSAQMDGLCDKNDYNGVLRLCEELEKYTHESPLIRLHIYYNIGSGYSFVGQRTDKGFARKNSGLALLNFRKSLAETKCFARESLSRIPSDEEMALYYDLRSRLLTNLANELDIQGRRLEALRYYDDPINSGNVHALLGKATCLHKLAQGIHNNSHSFYLHREAAHLYEQALSRLSDFPDPQQKAIEADPFYRSFVSWFSKQELQFGESFPELDSFKTVNVKTRKENDYLAWCAEHQLFINELNGISASSAVYHDELSLPNFLYRPNLLLTASETLTFHGHFDEMKTDYCYARYLAFMGSSIPMTDSHFFNSTFEHVDTLDYEISNLKTSHLKSCFRISYSIFDKISFFLHRFFEIDSPKNDHRIDFKKIWFKANTNHIKDRFESSDNDYFRALFFISSEIRQKTPKIPDSEDPSYWFDPDTNRLYELRNAMEHRALKLVDMFCHRYEDLDDTDIENHEMMLTATQSQIDKLLQGKSNDPDSAEEIDAKIRILASKKQDIEKDLNEKNRMRSYKVVVGVEEFETLTMKLLTLAKDALVYLSLAIHHEKAKESTDCIVVPTSVPKK